ncbi:MAG TPA: hypothetical protein VHT73_08035 [Thermodesulfobacteriota bacterium]|nr:hypothetical protein [Thermodesulfobacteriota bacterium]
MGSQPANKRVNEEIVDVLNVLFKKGDVIELRMPGTHKGTISGYFDNFQALSDVAMQASGKVPAVYVTLNPVQKDLLARANNRVKTYAKTTTSDKDIIHRRWFLTDTDAIRPKDISSTDEEHELALEKSQKIKTFLKGRGWADPVIANSGNGGHLLHSIDLPNDDESRDLIKCGLEALDYLFSDERVSVDTSVFNASRVVKLYGTMVCKGDNLPERPHRLSKLLDVPEHIEPVSKEQLIELAKLKPEEPKPERNFAGSATPLNLERWMSEHGICVRRAKPWQGGTVFELTECPFNPGHNNGEARIIQFKSRALSFGCFHSSCQGYDWQALRDKLEPGYRDKRQQKTSHEKEPVNKTEIPFPNPIADKAFHGLAGDIVGTIKPHSEADEVALLMNFLTSYGNVIGDNALFKVEADEHTMRINCVLVGNTSKARKGTSWGHIKNLFHTIDPDWTERVQTGLSSGEGLIWAVRDEITRRQPVKENGRVVGYEDVTIDEGVSDKRLLVIEGEFATTLRVMERDGNTLSPVIRLSWDTGNLQTLTKNSPAKATGAHISIVAHITRQELTRYLNATEAGNGFGNRFLWLCVKRSKTLPFGGTIHTVNFKPLLDRLKEAVGFGKTAGEITWADDTKPLWTEIYPGLSEGKPGLIGALTARAEAYVTRLACIYALLDSSTKIERVHLEAALAVWDYCEESVKYIFQDMTGDPLANKILVQDCI